MFPRFVVHGLTPGEQYIFRVKAVNAVGTSENSQESDVIKVQAPLSKCRPCPAPALGPGVCPLHQHTLRAALGISEEGRGKPAHRERAVLWKLLIHCSLSWTCHRGPGVGGAHVPTACPPTRETLLEGSCVSQLRALS